MTEGRVLTTALLDKVREQVDRTDHLLAQLFQYLKLMGLAVGTADLYVLRGRP